MAVRLRTIGVQGNTMTTLAGIYLYGIACIMCGIVIGVWLEGR